MKWLENYYRKRGKPVPYYARYSLGLILWKPVRKALNVVIIPNTPFNFIRIALYRLVGYRIGKNVFIGMKCYLDDVEPAHTMIEDDAIISYGVYFSLHGKGQDRSYIRIGKGAYIGMRANIVAGKEPLEIGEKAIIGAGSLVNRSVSPGATAVGVPARERKN